MGQRSDGDTQISSRPQFLSIARIRLICLAFALLSLWMRTGFPIHGIAHASDDDGLFVQLAHSLGAAEWLGPFDNRTLVKGMFYPLFILMAFVAGVPLKIAEQSVYLVAAYITASTIRVYTPKNPWFAIAVFVALAFNPMLWTDELARVIREGLYVSLPLAIIGLSIQASFPTDRQAPTRLRRATICGGLAGLVGGCFWLTREEGIWLLPSVLVIVVLALIDACRRRRHDGATVRQRFIDRALPWGSALLVMLSLVGMVATINRVAYGAFETTEVQSYAFRHAYGALARIRPDHWRRFVVFPGDARQRAYAVSPAARELAPTLDGPIGEAWRKTGCAQTGLSDCSEILAGWFQWALRDAVAQAGHYHSAREAAAYYTTLADQIDAACDQGRLPCLPERATLAPPFRWGYVGDTVRKLPEIAGILLSSGVDGIGVTASEGPADLTAALADFAGPVKPLATGLVRVQGWVASPFGSPTLQLQVGDGDAARSELDRMPAPDVLAAFPGQSATRFALQTNCMKPSCTFVVGVPGREQAAVPMPSLTDGASIQRDGFLLHVDERRPPNQAASATQARQDCLTRIAYIVAQVYRFGLSAGLVLAFAGTIACFFRVPAYPIPPAMVAMTLSSAAGVITRVALLAYLDVTAIPSANRLYASPASPLLIVVVMLGCYLGFAATFGPRRSSTRSISNISIDGARQDATRV